MGIVHTDEWLENHFWNLNKICELTGQDGKNTRSYSRYLQAFGMYQPTKRARLMFEQLKDLRAWDKFEAYFKQYRKNWNGPDLDIFIFPIQQTPEFMRNLKGRSGLTFPNKIFLFISPVIDEKMWESLFVHEYHHAARMNQYKKGPKDYHLLDSLIFEGLAEHAVRKYCGEEYNAGWLTLYNEKQLKHYWINVYKPMLRTNKQEPLHDQLLFGGRGIPKMMGYALGTNIVNKYNGSKPLSIFDSFKTSSEIIYKNSEVSSWK